MTGADKVPETPIATQATAKTAVNRILVTPNDV
jgi:hypothetical protein